MNRSKFIFSGFNILLSICVIVFFALATKEMTNYKSLEALILWLMLSVVLFGSFFINIVLYLLMRAKGLLLINVISVVIIIASIAFLSYYDGKIFEEEILEFLFRSLIIMVFAINSTVAIVYVGQYYLGKNKK
jgi:hypothetical protein